MFNKKLSSILGVFEKVSSDLDKFIEASKAKEAYLIEEVADLSNEISKAADVKLALTQFVR